jgi:N-acetylneuraminate synthase
MEDGGMNVLDVLKHKSSLGGFVTAEISANHNGSLSLMKETIQAAHECGADAVKIQTYTADDIVFRGQIGLEPLKTGLWKGQTLHELYQKAHTPYEWHAELFEFSKKIGCLLYSSPFSPAAVKLLVDVGCPIIKIASNEVTNSRLCKAVYETGLPVFASFGAGGEHDAWGPGSQKFTVAYHCQAHYPADDEALCMSRISHLLRVVGPDYLGWSCHLVDGVLTKRAIAMAVGAGATFFERHFTLVDDAPDSAFSSKPTTFKEYVRDVRECMLDMHTPFVPETTYTRVWVATRDIADGDEFVPGVNCDTFRPFVDGAVPADVDLTGYPAWEPVSKGNVIRGVGR